MRRSAEMSVAARSVSTDPPGMSGGTITQTTWAVREVPAGPLTRQGVPMAGNSRPTLERSGDRAKSLETALLQIERQFGKGSVMRLGDETRVPVEVIPVSYTHLRAHETRHDLVCRLLLEK